MRLDDAAVGVAALVAVEGAKLTQSFLPDLATLRKAGPGDSSLRKDLTVGELAAGLVVLIVSYSVAWATDSPAPLVIGLAVLVAMVGVYEWTYHTRSNS
jgi:hypothetical protein